VKFVCPHGHKDKYGRPEVHASRRLCSIQAQLDRVARGKPKPVTVRDGEPAIGVTPEPPQSPTGRPGPTAGIPPQAASAPRAGGWGAGPVYKPASATDSTSVNAPIPQAMDFEIRAETSENFGAIIVNVIETIANGICDLVGIAHLPSEVTDYDPGMKFMFRTTLRAPVGKFLKTTMGAKSPEHADEIVSGLGGLVAFGFMGFKIVLHFWKELPKSEKWRAFRSKMGGRLGLGKPRDRPKTREEADALRARAEEPDRTPVGPVVPPVGAIA